LQAGANKPPKYGKTKSMREPHKEPPEKSEEHEDANSIQV